MRVLTVKVKCFKPNTAKREKMLVALEEFRAACGFFAREAERLQTVSRNTLHTECYARSCALFTLNRPTLHLARDRALGARRSYLTRLSRGGPASPPTFERPVPVAVRRDSWRVERLESGGWIVRFPVAMARSRVTLPVHVADYHQGRLRDLAEGRCRQGLLEFWVDAKGVWYAALQLVYETVPVAASTFIGVDLGVCNLAVLSNNVFLKGRRVQWRDRCWSERRGALQRAGRLARVKREAGRERRWLRDLVHQASRTIVNTAAATGCGLALERLTGIRDRVRAGRKTNRALHRAWPFRMLAGFIAYKAEAAGVPVRWVDPRNTSRICCRCSYRAARNRRGRRFLCRSCGFQADADLVAARNIAMRAVNMPGS